MVGVTDGVGITQSPTDDIVPALNVTNTEVSPVSLIYVFWGNGVEPPCIGQLSK